MNLVDYVNDELAAEEQYKEVLKTKGLEAATRRLLWLFDDEDRQFSLLYRFEFLEEIEEKWIDNAMSLNDIYEKVCLSLVQISRQFTDMSNEVQKYSTKLRSVLPAEHKETSKGTIIHAVDYATQRHHFPERRYYILPNSAHHLKSKDMINRWLLRYHGDVLERFRNYAKIGIAEPALLKLNDPEEKKSLLVNVVDSQNIHAYSAVVGGSLKVVFYSHDSINEEISRHSNKLQLRNIKTVDVSKV